MDEESDDDIPSAKGSPPIPATQQTSHSQPPHPLRPRSAPSFGSFGSSAPSISEQYQPLSHMWRYVPPASSLWGSQSVEYIGQCDQQSFQHPRQQMLPSPLQTQQQLQQRTTTTNPVSTALGYAAEVLRDHPSPTQPSDYCCAIINDRLIK